MLRSLVGGLTRVGLLRGTPPLLLQHGRAALSSIPEFEDATDSSSAFGPPHDDPEDSAAKRAYSDLVATILSQASQRGAEAGDGDGDGGAETSTSTSSSGFQFEGLHMFDEQQEEHHVRDRTAANNPSHIERSLAAIRYHQSLMDGTPRGRRLQRNWQRQITLETRAVDAAIARYRREAEAATRRGAAATLPPARKLLVSWFKPLAQAIEQEQRRIARGAPGIDRSVYGPYLLQLGPAQLAVITLHCAVNGFMSPENEGDAVGARPGATRMTKLYVRADDFFRSGDGYRLRLRSRLS